MKIALIGYGKMGKAIEEIALNDGDEIVLKISSNNQDELTSDNLKRAEVAIEFTNPNSVVQNIITCFNASTPVVTGSTGWYKKLPELERDYAKTSSLFYAPNFSIGVNLFFALNTKLAHMMNSFAEYNVNLREAHHKQKLDSPSGTAIKLANDILEHMERKNQWREVKNELTDNKDSDELLIKAIREEGVIGEHQINYVSDTDEISIKHTAFNRSGFAQGALMAAKWLKNRKGFFTMQDMLQI